MDDTGAFRPHKELTAEPSAEAVAGTIRSAGYAPGAGVYRLTYRAAPHGPRTTTLSLPPGPWRVTAPATHASCARGPAYWPPPAAR
ncbi:hypothetical protein ABT133_34095 [Streptomyces sp. NPDC001835]|uniref:hypothetical protein n=1 Tax=Streptomyces sp. NPDC001835 TaxID=3154528 RepID=UPI003333B99C